MSTKLSEAFEKFKQHGGSGHQNVDELLTVIVEEIAASQKVVPIPFPEARESKKNSK